MWEEQKQERDREKTISRKTAVFLFQRVVFRFWSFELIVVIDSHFSQFSKSNENILLAFHEIFVRTKWNLIKYDGTICTIVCSFRFGIEISRKRKHRYKIMVKWAKGKLQRKRCPVNMYGFKPMICCGILRLKEKKIHRTYLSIEKWIQGLRQRPAEKTTMLFNQIQSMCAYIFMDW